MQFHVVIPARYDSERLPAKPLAMIAGKPLVQHTYERAIASGAIDVTVATDDERIAEACRAFGADAMLTSATHASGTDRIAEVAAKCGWRPDEIVVNLQGDEPLMSPPLIAAAAQKLAAVESAGIATLATPITDRREFENPNAVKVVCDAEGHALYFSRAPIPFERSAGSDSPLPAGEGPGVRVREVEHAKMKSNPAAGALRHIGLYAYRVETLKTLTQTPPCRLELAERLEQLRALWLGIHIAVETVDPAPPAGVDTAADLARVEAAMANL
ncbi:MAG TPA: 3-deoxy-manno-octulosonate cytidylyltransferase [Gammaproteobacteria bacterium]|nr:3-deoxy-manno-octulosonate cytidylyltransferase [Gammaproteobacteria bacterium]